jgi:hypothetical protein
MRGKTTLVQAICLLASLFFANVFLFNADSKALSGCDPSKKVSVIFARGSGQQLDDKEKNTVKTELQKVVSTDLYEYYELSNKLEGLDPNKDQEYIAIGVAGSPQEFLVGVEAVIKKSKIGAYRESVNTGKELLKKYLAVLEDRCVVLVGYSQGAQVVGEAVSELENEPKILNRILYVGLMGDPKLDTHGYSLLPGKDIPWIRGNVVPFIQSGLLGPRQPSYIPRLTTGSTEMFTKVGSWCYDDDLICTTNFAGGIIDNGHFKYSERAIPHMAREIASAINNPTSTIDKNLYPKETCGAAKQDIVVLLDTSAIMRRDRNLYSGTPMYDPYNKNTLGMPDPRTAGEQLTQIGCGDTRVAVVGYGLGSDGSPRQLLDFTSNPRDYDNLLSSLYQPSETGTYGRTQFREAALLAMNTNWRTDASHSVIAMAGAPGDGPLTWRGWSNEQLNGEYMKDPLTQQVIAASRKADAPIYGVPVSPDTRGYTYSDPQNINSGITSEFLRLYARATGAYNWINGHNPYSPYSFKNTMLEYSFNRTFKYRESTVATVPSIVGKVGQPLTLNVGDQLSYLAAAKLRSHSVGTEWFVDCGVLTQQHYDMNQKVTWTPVKPGKCTGTVMVKVANQNGSGCYSGCPEPFPPYMLRSIPFEIDVRPADYVAKIPSSISNLQKVIYDDSVEYVWDEPEYNGSEPVVYLIREPDGAVLAATTSRKLTITDTNGTDPAIQIIAGGEDGKATPVSSETAAATDRRTIAEEPTNTGEPPNTDTNPLPASASSPTGEMATTSNITPGQTISNSPGQSTGQVVVSIATTPNNTSEQVFVTDPPNVLGDTAVAKLTDPATIPRQQVDVRKGSVLSVIMVPLSVAVALGLIVATSVFIRVKYR